jgi:hypothetical protein
MLYDYITNEDEDAIIILDTSKLIDVEDLNTLTESTILNEANIRQTNKLMEVALPIPLKKKRPLGKHYDSRKGKWVDDKEQKYWWRESKKNSEKSHSYYLLPIDIEELNDLEGLGLKVGSYRCSDHWSSLIIRNFKTNYYYKPDNENGDNFKELCRKILEHSKFKNFEQLQYELLKNGGFKLDVRIKNIGSADGRAAGKIWILDMNEELPNTKKFINTLINNEDNIIWNDPTNGLVVYLYGDEKTGVVTIFFDYLDMKKRCGFTTNDLSPWAQQ